MSSRQKRRLQHAQKLRADEGSAAAEKKPSRDSSPVEEAKAVPNKWEEIYGANSGKVNDLIKKQAQGIEDRANKKKKK